MSEKEPKDEILELIQLVDLNRDKKGKPLFRETDFFAGSIPVMIGLLCLLPVAYFVLYLKLISYGDYVLAIFTILVAILAFFSLIVQAAEENAFNSLKRIASPSATEVARAQVKTFTERLAALAEILIII